MYKAYRQIANALDMPEASFPLGEEAFDGYRFMGATSRAFLYRLAETPFVLDFDISPLEFADAEETSSESRTPAHIGMPSKALF